LRYGIFLYRRHGVAMPATNLVKEIYALAIRNGLREQDVSLY
jgi:3-hydroxyisobutyrate dehydrogenase-like beta-hydroxyacid dehydrogenase